MELEVNILSTPADLSAIAGGSASGSEEPDWVTLPEVVVYAYKNNNWDLQFLHSYYIRLISGSYSSGSKYIDYNNSNSSGGGGGTTTSWNPIPNNYYPGSGNGYTNGSYSPESGYSNGSGNPDYNVLLQKFENILSHAGAANGIQTLSHSAINYLISATGGTAITGLSEVASKTGLGKIALVGVVYDGVKTIVAFSDGDISGEDWEQLGKTVIGGLSYVPGPIGLISTGVSLVILAVEE